MRERLKSAALILLLLLAVALSYISLTLGLHTDGQYLLGLFEQKDALAKASSEELFSAEAAARPDSLCLIGTDGVYRAMDDFDLCWELVQPFYEEALGSGDIPKSLKEYQYSALLKAPALLISYAAPQPFSLLRVWSDASAVDSKLKVSSAILCVEDGSITLAFRDESGNCWKMCTAASVQLLLELCSGETNANADLAVHDLLYHALVPEETVLRQRLSYPIYTAEPVLAASTGELPRAVLTAFSLNPYLTNVYPDSEGGLVYVEEHSTLAVTSAGDLVYSAAPGGIPYLQPEHENQAMQDARVCEASYHLLCDVWNKVDADGNLSLDSLVYDKNTESYTLQFELELHGVFFNWKDQYWAQVVAKNGYIIEVRMCPRRLTEGETEALLPMRQAVAALEESAHARLRVRFMESKENIFRPAICQVMR